MSESPRSGELQPDLEEQVDRACDAFEAAWQAGQRPRVEDYLRDTADPARPALLGQGGMGVVYKARHCALGRVVALKMIRAGQRTWEEALERFRREAVADARFDHPNIVRIHDKGEHEGQPYFSMEFIDGGTL